MEVRAFASISDCHLSGGGITLTSDGKADSERQADCVAPRYIAIMLHTPKHVGAAKQNG